MCGEFRLVLSDIGLGFLTDCRALESFLGLGQHLIKRWRSVAARRELGIASQGKWSIPTPLLAWLVGCTLCLAQALAAMMARRSAASTVCGDRCGSFPSRKKCALWEYESSPP